MSNKNSRRDMIKTAAALAFASTTLSPLTNRVTAHTAAMDANRQGNINDSVCAWCYNDIPLEDLCKAANKIGLESIALLDPKDFATVKKYDLTCAMVASINKDWGITKGWNRVEHHDRLVEYYQYLID